jgi:hypothetical protein
MEITNEDGPRFGGIVSPNSEMMDEDLIIDSTFPLLYFATISP